MALDLSEEGDDEVSGALEGVDAITCKRWNPPYRARRGLARRQGKTVRWTPKKNAKPDRRESPTPTVAEEEEWRMRREKEGEEEGARIIRGGGLQMRLLLAQRARLERNVPLPLPCKPAKLWGLSPGRPYITLSRSTPSFGRKRGGRGVSHDVS